MQTTLNRPPKLPKDGGGPLSSKNGSIAAAGVAVVIAGLLIIFFLSQYRDNVNAGGVPTPVLVAEKSIEKGASGDSAGAQGLFKSTTVPRDQLKPGALTDAAVLRGKVAVGDILPGQQLTAKDFRLAGNGIITKLAPDQRAIAISLDSAHGLTGKVRVGDHVDVLSGVKVENDAGRGRAVLRMLMQDVLVLDVPPKASAGVVGASANQASEVTLRVTAKAASTIAFAADNGQLWLVLRPQNGANVERSAIVTIASLLAAGDPVKVPAPRSTR